MKFKVDIETLNISSVVKVVNTMAELIAFQSIEDKGVLSGDLRTDYKIVNDEIDRTRMEIIDDLKALS